MARYLDLDDTPYQPPPEPPETPPPEQPSASVGTVNASYSSGHRVIGPYAVLAAATAPMVQVDSLNRASLLEALRLMPRADFMLVSRWARRDLIKWARDEIGGVFQAPTAICGIRCVCLDDEDWSHASWIRLVRHRDDEPNPEIIEIALT